MVGSSSGPSLPCDPNLDGDLVGVVATNVTITNSCKETLWIATYGNPSLPAADVSFVLAPDASKSVFPNATWTGSLWAQTNCTTYSHGPSQCLTGGCSGNEICKGQPPVSYSITLANLFLNENGAGQDRYEVSLNRGFNVPMALIPSVPAVACNRSSCQDAEVNAKCPPELSLPEAPGKACLSPCMANDAPTCLTYPNYLTHFYADLCPRANVGSTDLTHYTCTTGVDYEVIFCPFFV